MPSLQHSANIMTDTEQCLWFGVLTRFPIVKKFVKACVSLSVGDVLNMEHEAINHNQELVSDEFQQQFNWNVLVFFLLRSQLLKNKV